MSSSPPNISPLGRCCTAHRSQSGRGLGTPSCSSAHTPSCTLPRTRCGSPGQEGGWRTWTGRTGPGWGSSGERWGRGRPCTGGGAPPSPCPPTSQPETLTVISDNQCFEFTTGVISMLALLFWRRQRSRGGRYKALELLWAFAGPQRLPCLLPCPIAIAAPCLILLHLLHFVAIFYYLPPACNAVAGLSMASPQWLDNSASHTVHELRLQSRAELWMEETASNFLISCPPTKPSHSCSKVPLFSNASCVAIPVLMDHKLYQEPFKF